MSENDPSVPFGYCHCGCGQKTTLAKQTIPKRGLVKGEPNRYLPNHHRRVTPSPGRPETPAERAKRWRERNPDAARENSAAWRARNPERAKEVKQAFYERHRERLLAERRERYERDRDKELARTAVANAIKAGKLQRGECEVGEGCQGAIHGHHDDYSKPLEVRWLCAHHHAQLHFGK